MKKDYLENEGNALKVQKHQLNNAEDKLSEINSILIKLEEQQIKISQNNKLYLDSQDLYKIKITEDEYKESLEEIKKELLSLSKNYKKKIEEVKELDNIKIDKNTTWNEYIDLVEEYGFKQNINLKEDPFKHLMTKSQQVELQKRIKKEFTIKNAKCDNYDYMIAGTCGVIGGLIDILFVGAPKDSKLGNIADEQANKITEKFAEFVGWDKDKAIKKGKNTTASAIGYLEKKFTINYDQATTHSTNGEVENLSFKNHHLKSLGHSPDLIGLFFSILNQFTNTSTFVSNGQIITIDTKTFKLQGNDFLSKIFCGFANWFGHIMSDWSGSSGTVGQGGRGTGVPIPFFNLFQMMNFGEFGENKQTFATITTKVFENGYDARHGMAMAIPVVTTELLIRFMYTMKAHFYHKKDWKDSIPNGDIPELSRMLLVGHGTLCLIDGVDAGIRSGGSMVKFLSRTNLLAWVKFGQLSLKEISNWYNEGHIDADAVDEYLDKEFKSILSHTQSISNNKPLTKIKNEIKQDILKEEKFINSLVVTLVLMTIIDKKIKQNKIDEFIALIKNIDEIEELGMTTKAITLYKQYLNDLMKISYNPEKLNQNIDKLILTLEDIKIYPKYLAMIKNLLEYLLDIDNNKTSNKIEMNNKILEFIQ